MNKIIILGRGASLEKLKEFKNEYNIDTVILVNTFWDSPQVPVAYYKDELIHNFIKDKKIILIMTPCCNTSNIKPFLENYNVINIYKTKFSKYKRVDKSDKLCKVMPESALNKYIEIDKLKIKKQGDAIPGSLSYAILIAVEELKCSEIFIFGQDFYEKDYYLTNNHNYKNESKPSEIELNKNDITNFFSHLSNTKFYIYTLANYNPKVNNITCL